MRHQHTTDSTQQDDESRLSRQVIVQPSVLSILYYLDELEAQVPVPEDDPPVSNPHHSSSKHESTSSPSSHPTH